MVAWLCLADDPAGPELYRLMFGALAVAVVADPTLLDDPHFATCVAGWRSLPGAGLADEQDPVAAAHARGAVFKPDKAETQAWARIWAERRP